VLPARITVSTHVVGRNRIFGARTNQRVLVGGGDDLELLRGGVVSLNIATRLDCLQELVSNNATHQPAPPAPLDRSSLGVEALLELLHRAEVALDSALQRAVFELPAVVRGGCEVLPEQRVVNVACAARRSLVIHSLRPILLPPPLNLSAAWSPIFSWTELDLA
jgi:hypothetical protein